MRTRTAVGVFAGALSVLVLARPAYAQSAKVDLAGGYQYFRFVGYYDDPLPTGWGFSAAVGKDRVKFAADVGGNYGAPMKYRLYSVDHFEDYYGPSRQVHTFQGGVEFSGSSARVVPFGRLLAGAAVISSYGNSVGFVITPEAGVKVMITDHLGAQVAAGFPAMVNGDGSANSIRLFAGVVYRK